MVSTLATADLWAGQVLESSDVRQCMEGRKGEGYDRLSTDVLFFVGYPGYHPKKLSTFFTKLGDRSCSLFLQN